MIPAQALLTIAQRLLEKSKANEVEWLEDSGTHFVSVTGLLTGRHGLDLPEAVRVVLPESQVYLGYFSPKSNADYIQLDLCTKDGRPVSSWTIADGDEHWEMMYDLFSEATRAVTGWDVVLKDIETAVGLPGRIGLAEATPQPNVEASFLQWASGKWLLKFTPKGGRTNSEQVEIRPDGTYLANGVPKFTLSNVSFDPVAKVVSFDKVCLTEHPRHPSGSVYHREELEILSDNAMYGHRAGVPEHTLDYTRVK